MLKIMYVDDDAIIRRGMEQKIKWQTYNWELVYIARDAMEALEYIKENLPDIILCDIMMPGINGIEMAKIAKEYNPLAKFIFISGHKEFELARQVLQVNAVDYLTKPVDQEKLFQAIKKAEYLFLQEQRSQSILKEKYPEIKRNYISRLMREKFQNMQGSFFETFDINITTGLGITAFIDLNPDEEMEEYTAKNAIESYCDYLTDVFKGSFFFCMDSMQIFMIYTNSQADQMVEFQAQLQICEEEIKRYAYSELNSDRVDFSYGSIMKSLSDLYPSYQEATRKVNTQIHSLLEEVRRFIEENYSDSELSLMGIAKHFHLNHCYLTSVYRKKFHINLYDYIIKMRMESAANLIINSGLKNFEIAELSGYKNPQYFSMSFRKYFNCTVTEYRANYKK